MIVQIILPGFQNTAIDTSLGLESNNSTYITRTGGTHKSNVHNANTHRSDKTYKKGTIDLDTANSHRSAGGAGGSAEGHSLSTAGAAGGRAAGGQGGMGGAVIIHQQPPLQGPMTVQGPMSSTELLITAIGSTIALILLIIAGAIVCRSVYRDQLRSYNKRQDKMSAKKAKEAEQANSGNRASVGEPERLISVLPDVAVNPSLAPHRQATQMLHAMTPLSQTFATSSPQETGLLQTTPPVPAPSAPPPEYQRARCPRRHVSSTSGSDLSPIPLRAPRRMRARGLSRSRDKTHDQSCHDMSHANFIHSSTMAKDMTDQGLSMTCTRQAHVREQSPSLPITNTGHSIKANGTFTNCYTCATPRQPAPSCTSGPTPLPTGISCHTSCIQKTNGSQLSESLQERDLLTFHHFTSVLDNQQRIIGHLMQAQETADSLPSTKTSATPTNPHRSLWSRGGQSSMKKTTPGQSISATATTEIQTPSPPTGRTGDEIHKVEVHNDDE